MKKELELQKDQRITCPYGCNYSEVGGWICEKHLFPIKSNQEGSAGGDGGWGAVKAIEVPLHSGSDGCANYTDRECPMHGIVHRR